MAKKILAQKYFNGGISESEKEGIQGSFFFGQKLNILADPSQLSILPATVKDSGATVVDLPMWIVSGAPHDTNTYFYGDQGHIYQRTSAGGWSSLRTVTGSRGNGMDIYSDYLYYAQNTQLGRYGPLSGAPSFTDAWYTTTINDTSLAGFAPVKAFNGYVFMAHGNKLLQTDGTTTTAAKLTLPSGLNIRALEVIDEFLAIGTWRGDSLTDNEEGYVFFWDGVSVNYNFFTKIEDGGCNALLNSRNRLLSVLGSSGFIYMNYNPFQKLQQLPKLKIGSFVEVFPGAVTAWKGQAIIGFAGNTDSTDIYQGLYQWGSRSEKYPEVLNYAWPISTAVQAGVGPSKTGKTSGGTFADDATVGTIAWGTPANAAAAEGTNTTNAVAAAGVSHYLLATNFGFAIPSTATVQGIEIEVRKSEDADTNNITDNTVRIIKGAAIGATDRSNATEWPVALAYTIYGGPNDMWGETFTPAQINASNFGFAISAKATGGVAGGIANIDHIRIRVYYTTTTILQIGSCKGIGNNLFVGWRSGTSYGVDKITNSGAPFTSATMESLLFDERRAGEDKLGLTIKATHLALAANETIQLGYKTNRAANYTTDTANSTAGSTETNLKVPFTDGRFKEFEFEVILGASATSPTVTSIGLEYDDLKEEKQY
jgi:hypothetical protein